MPGTILGTGSITVTEAGSMCQLSRSVHSSGETDTRPNTPDKRVTLAAGLGLLGGGGCVGQSRPWTGTQPVRAGYCFRPMLCLAIPCP